MIKLESVNIEWARGIAQKLDLDFQQKTFASSGPSGSGKSAVIDAIEFALANLPALASVRSADVSEIEIMKSVKSVSPR